MNHLVKYIIACMALLVFAWIVLRVIVRRDYSMRGRLSITVSILQVLLFFIYGGFPYLYLQQDWPTVHVGVTLHIIGMVFIIVGLAALFYGMLKLGILPSIGYGRQALKRTGIYRVSRNPQALACGLYVLGFLMLWPSWYALSWAVLFFVIIHIMIITEEEHLLRIYGVQYQVYRDEVPRYLRVLPESKEASG